MRKVATWVLLVGGLAAGGSPPWYPQEYCAALEKCFLKDGTLARRNLQALRAKLSALRSQAQELYAREEAVRKGKSLKKARRGAAGEDLVCACTYAIDLVSALSTTQPFSSRFYGLADRLCQVLAALCSEPPLQLRTYIAELALWDSFSAVSSLLWVPGVSQGPEAANLLPAPGRDLSRIDPLPGPLWSSQPPEALALHDALPIPKAVRFLSIKAKGVQPKFRATFRDPKTGKKIKVKVKTGQEVHATVFAALVLAQLGYHTNGYRYAQHLKVYFKSAQQFESFKAFWRWYYARNETPFLRKDFETFWVKKSPESFLFEDKEGCYAVLKSAVLEYLPKEVVRVGWVNLNHFAFPWRREVRGLLPIFAWLHLHDTYEANFKGMLTEDPSHPLGYRWQIVVADVGMSLSSVFGVANPNWYFWEPLNVSGTQAAGGTRAVTFSSYRELYPLAAFKRATASDIRWAVRKLAALKRSFLEEALARAAFPAPVRYLYEEALVSARNNLVVAFGLKNECGLLPAVPKNRLYVAKDQDGNWRKYDGRTADISRLQGPFAVWKGRLLRGTFPSSVVVFSVDIPYHLRTLLKAFGDATWDLVLEGINQGLEKALRDNIEVEGKPYFTDEKVFTVGSFRFRVGRKITPNEFSASDKDRWMVTDRLAFLVRLGPDIDIPLDSHVFARAAFGAGYGQELLHVTFAPTKRSALRHRFFSRFARALFLNPRKAALEVLNAQEPQSYAFTTFVENFTGFGLKAGSLLLGGQEIEGRRFLVESTALLRTGDRLDIIHECDPGVSVRNTLLVQLFLRSFVRMKFSVARHASTLARYRRRVYSLDTTNPQVRGEVEKLLGQLLAGTAPADMLFARLGEAAPLGEALSMYDISCPRYHRRSAAIDLILWEARSESGAGAFDWIRYAPGQPQRSRCGYAYGFQDVKHDWVFWGLKERRRVSHEIGWQRTGGPVAEACLVSRFDLRDNNTSAGELTQYVAMLNLLGGSPDFMPVTPDLYGQENFGPLRVKITLSLSKEGLGDLFLAALEPHRAVRAYLTARLAEQRKLFQARSWKEFYREEEKLRQEVDRLLRLWQAEIGLLAQKRPGLGLSDPRLFLQALDGTFRGVMDFLDLLSRLAAPDATFQQKAAVLAEELSEEGFDPVLLTSLLHLIGRSEVYLKAEIRKDPLVPEAPNLLPLKIPLLSADSGTQPRVLFVDELFRRYRAYLGDPFGGLRVTDYRFFLD